MGINRQSQTMQTNIEIVDCAEYSSENDFSFLNRDHEDHYRQKRSLLWRQTSTYDLDIWRSRRQC